MGVVLVTAAIAIAVHEPDREQHERRQILAGVLWGVVAMASLALSIVLMKGALARVGALDAVTLRIGAGFLALLPVGLLGRSGRRSLATLTASRAHWRYTISGSFLGMYGSSILWVLGMKHTLASIASSLNQLSNVFVFILGVVFLHERLTPRKVAGDRRRHRGRHAGRPRRLRRRRARFGPAPLRPWKWKGPADAGPVLQVSVARRSVSARQETAEIL